MGPEKEAIKIVIVPPLILLTFFPPLKITQMLKRNLN